MNGFSVLSYISVPAMDGSLNGPLEHRPEGSFVEGGGVTKPVPLFETEETQNDSRDIKQTTNRYRVTVEQNIIGG